LCIFSFHIEFYMLENHKELDVRCVCLIRCIIPYFKVNFLLVMKAFTACVCCRFSRLFPPQIAVFPSVYHLKLKYYNVQNCNLVIVLYGCQNCSPIICGNKMPTRYNRGFYCRSYCLLNMFWAPPCSSSGAQEYYTVLQHPANRTHNPQLHTRPTT